MQEQVDKIKKQQDHDLNTVTDIIRGAMQKQSLSEMASKGIHLCDQDHE